MTTEQKPVFVFPSDRTLSPGMTLRDYFAAEALPIATERYPEGHPLGWLGVAEAAYAIADAMLAARGQK